MYFSLYKLKVSIDDEKLFFPKKGKVLASAIDNREFDRRDDLAKQGEPMSSQGGAHILL